MTLTDFSRDVVPILQVLISFIGVGGVFLLWYQIRTTNKWNKANSQHSMLSNLPSQEIEICVWNIVDKLEKDDTGSITEKSAAKVYENIENWVKVKSFLNSFEHLCAAINAKSIDEDYSYSVHSARITDIYYKFQHYITFIRKLSNDDEIYIELQKVASRWHERYIDTKNKRKKQLIKIEKKLRMEKGAKPIVP